MIPIRKTIKRFERFLVYRILHADDTPHRLALGIALGIFVAWTPTIGLQMVLVLLLASLVRANGRVGVPLVWISNPLTMVFIYYPNYLVGRYLLGWFADQPRASYSYEKLRAHLDQMRLRGIFTGEFWRNLGDLVLEVGAVELIVGSVVVGLVLGGIMYIVSYRFIVWYRTHNPIFQRLHLRRKKEASLGKTE